MHTALPADLPYLDHETARSSSAPSRAKLLVAGVAMASAGVLAVTPVTPTVPDVRQAAVELAAFTNPLTTLQETLANSFANLGTLGTGIPAASTALGGALTNPAVLSQIVNLITANAANPTAALTQLLNAQATYGNQISTALQSSTSILQTNLANLPTILQNTLGYLQTGQFVEAFSEVNIYFLVQLLERPGVPLFPLFTIPGDIAAAIPGGQILANVLDAVLTRGIATGLTRALFVAPITATLFIAETLDHIQASMKAGDMESALSELINAPLGFVNAFLNGYVPDFPSRSPFAGLLSPNGFFDYFLVDVPNALATALTRPAVTVPAVAAPTASSFAQVSSTDVAPASQLITLGSDAIAETIVETAAAEPVSAPEVEAVAEVPADTAVEVAVTETPAIEVEAATATTSTEATEPTTATSAVSTGTDAKSDTKSDADAKTDTDTDTKSATDAKADAKSDDKSDAKSDSKSDDKSDAKSDSKSGGSDSGSSE